MALSNKTPKTSQIHSGLTSAIGAELPPQSRPNALQSIFFTASEKKKNIVLFLFLFPIFSLAQNSSVLLQSDVPFHNASFKNIIRNYNDTLAVGYLKNGDTNWFYYMYVHHIFEESQPSITYLGIMDIGKRYEVEDIRFYKDTVFFCGHDTLWNGIVGKFAISKFFENSTSLISTIYTKKVKNIKRMVVYDDESNSAARIVALGTQSENVESYPDCVIDIKGFDFTTSIRASLPHDTTYYKEYWDDINLTDREIVITGMQMDGMLFVGNLVMRMSDRHFPISIQLNTLHHYHFSTDTILLPQHSKATIFNRTQLAIQHQLNKTQGGHSSNIAVAFIDLSGNLECYDVQQKPFFERDIAHTVKYIPETEKLIVGFSILPYAVYAHFFVFHPSDTNTYFSPQLSTNFGEKYNSLDLLYNDSFMAAGNGNWYFQRTTNTAFYDPCIPSISTPTETLPSYKHTHYPKDLKVSIGHGKYRDIPYQKKSIYLLKTCTK